MKILGIVAEYDPFHNGHLFHLSESKKLISPDFTYAVISPCFRQRGSLSLLSPSDRAACALEAGADAVFSLPVCWTVRDAEHYALGAVSQLAALGVTHLSFGAESSDLSLLVKTADFLENPSSSFNCRLKESLSAGMGYPAAVSSSLSDSLPEAAGLLDHPNNILAVCYLRAILRMNLSIQPVVIPRRGNYHAYAADCSSPSASALCECLRRGDYKAAFDSMPDYSSALVRRRFLDGRIPDERILDDLLLFRLRNMTASDYSSLPDKTEGIDNALRTAASSARSRRDLLLSVSCRRYPSARISRLCAFAMLGITKNHLDTLPLPDHALLLGLRRNQSMTSMWKSLSVPVVSSFSEWKKAADPSDLAAWRLWAHCCHLPDTLPFTEKTVIH